MRASAASRCARPSRTIVRSPWPNATPSRSASTPTASSGNSICQTWHARRGRARCSCSTRLRRAPSRPARLRWISIRVFRTPRFGRWMPTMIQCTFWPTGRQGADGFPAESRLDKDRRQRQPVNVSWFTCVEMRTLTMRSPVRIAPIIWLGFFLIVAATGLAQRRGTSPTTSSGSASDTTARIVAAAQAFLTSLDDAGRAKVQFGFDDGAQKTRWSNLPSPMFERKGIRIGDLTPTQRAAETTLLQAALSADGYRKVTEIMRGDEVLRTNQSGGGPRGGAPGPGGRGRGPAFGQDEYYLAFLGTPSTTAPWMLQYGGHHLAINLTLSGSQASMTPSLPATQPATFTIEGREIRPLGRENDKAFALINALNDDQRKQAILGSRVADLVLGPGQDGRTIQPEGIRASALTAAQQTMLVELVRDGPGIMTEAFGEPRMAESRRNLRQPDS